MLLSPKKWSVLGLLLMSSQVMAGTATFSGVVDGGSNFNQFSVLDNNGKTVNVSGWSDTAGNVDSTDPYIERVADMGKYNGGWWVINKDEVNKNNCGYGHSADNLGNCGYKDYDFFMIEFEQEVTLTSATFSWVTGNNGQSNTQRAAQNQVSVAALNNSTTDLTNKTWQGIKNSDTLGSGYSQMQYNSGYYIDTTVSQSSKVWLIGAFNAVFGGNESWEGNDGFKLSGVSYTMNTPPDSNTIPEPSSIAMLGLALVGLSLNRRKKLH